MLGNYQYTVYKTIGNIDRELWDLVNHEDKTCLSYNYLKAVEDAPPANMAFRYLTVSVNSEIIGVIPFQILRLSKSIFSRKVGTLSYGRQNSYGFSVLFVGNSLISGEYAFSFIRPVSGEELSHIIKNAEKYVKRSFSPLCHFIGTVVKDFSEGHSVLNKEMPFYGFSSIPNMVIKGLEQYGTLDEYISAMKKKYQRRLRSVIKKGKPLVRRDLKEEEILQYKDEIYALYRQVHDNARFRIVSLNPDTFYSLKCGLKERFTLTGYVLEDKLIAFTTRIHSHRNSVLEGYVHGLDYSLNKRYEIYQSILLDDIRTAIESKIPVVNMGRTSIAMKSSVGAVTQPLTFYTRVKFPLLNSLLMPRLQLVQPELEYCRNPFA